MEVLVIFDVTEVVVNAPLAESDTVFAEAEHRKTVAVGLFVHIQIVNRCRRNAGPEISVPREMRCQNGKRCNSGMRTLITNS